MTRSATDPLRWISRHRLHGLLLRGRHPKTAEDVVGRLTAVQAQEHAYARWSVAQRMTGSRAVAAVDAAFDDGRILRTHVLRPTWHYVAASDLRWLIHLSGPRVDAANGRRHDELGLDVRTLNRSNEMIARAVEGRARTRRELAEILDERGISTAGQRIAYLLMHAELTSVICSGGMRGREHTYAAFDQRVPAGRRLEGDEALAELAWRYFSTRGPATLSDFSWWSGLRIPEARRALGMADSRLASHEIDGRIYWHSDLGTARSSSGIDLVQCYDEVIISYSQSRDVLNTPSVAFPVPRHLAGFSHVLLRDGRLFGHWRAHRERDELRVETRTDARLDRKDAAALARAIERFRRSLPFASSAAES